LRRETQQRQRLQALDNLMPCAHESGMALRFPPQSKTRIQKFSCPNWPSEFAVKRFHFARERDAHSKSSSTLIAGFKRAARRCSTRRKMNKNY